MKTHHAFTARFIAAMALLVAALALVASMAAAQSSKGGSGPIKGNPDDISYPLQEGFESGSLGASAFRSEVATCTSGGCGWSVVNTDKHTGTYSAFAPDVANVSDQRLVLGDAISIPASAYEVTVTFWMSYTFEGSAQNHYDGGVLEVSTNGGSTWSDSQVQWLSGGYNGTVHTGNSNPLEGRQAWVGSTGGVFTQTRASLVAFAGQNILIRFREGTDSSVGAAGWWIDDIKLSVSSPISCQTPAWSLRTNYPINTAWAASATQDGLLYVFGGVNNSGQTLDSAYKYDPATDSWSAIASLPAPRYGAAAVSDGTYIYVLGGNDTVSQPTNTVWRYDPTTNTYTPRAPYSFATYAHATAFLNGYIYRIGGSNNNISTNTVEVYQVSSNTWFGTLPYPSNIQALSAVAYGGYIYTAGGADNNGGGAKDKTYRYNPATGQWEDSPIADLPQTRWGAASGLLNGRWILAGGSNPLSLDSAIAWDPATNTWSTLPDVAQGRVEASGGTIGQVFYMVGGQNDNSVRSNYTRRYIEVPCVPFTPTPPACTMTFSDVHPSDYFYNDVHVLYCLGAISGYADGSFRPFNNTTRGQLSKIIVLAEGWQLQNPPNPTFNDVAPGSTFYQYVETAVAHSIISGYADGSFRPNNNVTRGQLSKIIVLAEGWPLENPQTPTFNDVAYGSAFYQYVETAYAHHVISGYADGTFRPGNSATRSQICKIVAQAITQP